MLIRLLSASLLMGFISASCEAVTLRGASDTATQLPGRQNMPDRLGHPLFDATPLTAPNLVAQTVLRPGTRSGFLCVDKFLPESRLTLENRQLRKTRRLGGARGHLPFLVIPKHRLAQKARFAPDEIVPKLRKTRPVICDAPPWWR